MNKETMNVHQALAELKMMDKRIEAATREPEWVITNKHSNTKINGVEVKDWIEDIKSKYRKVLDLIRRRDAIKRAVVNSNAVTKITVAGKEYTVAEAIDRKNNGVQYQKNLVLRMNHDYVMAKSSADRANGSELERRADDHVRIMFGNSDMKGSSQEAVRVRNEFIQGQTTDILDPIGVVAEVEKMNEEVNDFLMNVDAALSVSNALTVITVEY